MKTLLKISSALFFLLVLLPSCEREPLDAPAPAKPSLAIETVKGPEKEDCGGFEWRVKFKLKDADTKKGWVVQKISFVKKINNCDESPKENETLTFWEAWQVLLPRKTDSLWYLGNGTYDDMYRSPNHPNTKGEKDIKGQVKFFENQDLPATFKKNNPDTYAGGLPSSKEKPAFWDDKDALDHNLNTTWVCCDATSTSTVTTTPEVKEPVKGKVPDFATLDPIGRLIYEGIPAWTEGYGVVESAQLVLVAREIAAFPVTQLHASLENYAAVFSGTTEEVEAFSKVYLLLRALYDLPVNIPRNAAKVFGGWIHPSIEQSGTGFNLSWPVSSIGTGPSATLAVTGTFAGYYGKTYDAMGELDYFDGAFAKRGF